MSFECPNGGKGKPSASSGKSAARTATLRGKAAKGFHYKGGGMKRNLGALATFGMGLMSVMLYMRGTSVNAAEAMVQRVFLAMGIRSDRRHNARVLAVRMWQQGRVIVR